MHNPSVFSTLSNILECFAKIVDDYIFAKRSMLDVWRSSEYGSASQSSKVTFLGYH